VKGGKRIPFEIVHNSTSFNLHFSTGAWNHVVLPTAQYWNSIKGDKVCKVGPITVKVASVSFGLEADKKHIDTLVVCYADRDFNSTKSSSLIVHRTSETFNKE
jgi:hypothetical protein